MQALIQPLTDVALPEVIIEPRDSHGSFARRLAVSTGLVDRLPPALCRRPATRCRRRAAGTSHAPFGDDPDSTPRCVRRRGSTT
jgi:hypothetical protein